MRSVNKRKMEDENTCNRKTDFIKRQEHTYLTSSSISSVAQSHPPWPYLAGCMWQEQWNSEQMNDAFVTQEITGFFRAAMSSSLALSHNGLHQHVTASLGYTCVSNLPQVSINTLLSDMTLPPPVLPDLPWPPTDDFGIEVNWRIKG